MIVKVKSLINSFQYAFCGIINCIKNERNFRIHIVAAIYIITLALLMQISKNQLAILIITIGLVLTMEAINTSIENIVDLISPDKNPKSQNYNIKAKIAKDTASAAVLIMAVTSALVGFFLLWQPDKLVKITYTILSNPLFLLLLIISMIISISFIFGFKEKE